MCAYTLFWVSQMKDANLREARLCVCANLRQATRAVTQLYDEMLKDAGLKATQFSLLVTVSIADSTTIADLAQTMVIDRTTLTRNLGPLEKRGLIKTAPGSDRRTRLVTMTSRGQKRLARALPLWEEAQKKMISGLGQDNFDELLQLLSRSVSVPRP